MSGERKAAILVVMLGEQVSGELLKHLSRREVARIAREIAQLGPIDTAVADEVLREYYVNALEVPREQGGPDMARRILLQASISEEIADQLLGGRDPEATEGGGLGPLLEAPPETLAHALADEHPQTSALVLLHLPPRRAAHLLRALPDDARAETVLRMATLRQVPGEVLGEVATSLQERLSRHRTREERDGLERTAVVLANLPRVVTKAVLDELEGEHPDEVARLRSELFTFDSLRRADDRGMQELLRQLDSTRIAVALHGAEEPLQQRFLGNLSERAASMLKEEMEYLGTPAAPDVAAAQKEILDLALKMEAEDRLVFAEPGDDD
jgi:flagellar motor switch protein FliG